jgi:outer membrane protein assembly factor BamB
LALASVGFGDDWPQWMGPTRDNVWREAGIVEKFPEGGPKRLWSAKVASGYAGPAVAGGFVFITDYQSLEDTKVDNFEPRKVFTGRERVYCLKESDGSTVWTYDVPVKYGISYPAGPRCTPLVHDGMVYTLGAEGHLACLRVSDGKPIWVKELKEAYQTGSATWGFAAHPFLDGDRLITLAGTKGNHVIALDRRTGKELWKAHSTTQQGYSPPRIFEFGGKRQLIVYSPTGVRSHDPETGLPNWTVPYMADYGSIIMSPVLIGNQYLYCAGYNNKNLLLKVGEGEPTESFRDKRGVIHPVNVQPFVIDDVLYGCDQRGDLMAIRIPSGERLWSTLEPFRTKRPPNSATAFLIRHENRFFVFTELGELLIADLSPSGYKELDKAKILEPTNNAYNRAVVWSMPAFANRRMYARNDKEIVAIDLAK